MNTLTKSSEGPAQRNWLSRNRVLTAFFVVVLALIPIVPTPEFWITLLNYIGLYSLVALGLVLLTGVGGLTSFGQAAFVGLGAYSTAYLTTQYGVSPWIGLLAGIVITVVSAYVIGLITMRMSGHYLPLATIAWGLSLFFLFGNLEFLGKYDGLNGIPAINVFGWTLASGRHMYFLIWLVVLLAVVAVQIMFGAFVAGLDAGLAYNTWPLMDGRFVPTGLWQLSPHWINIFENHITVQFIHRMLAYTVALLAVYLWWRIGKRAGRAVREASHYMLMAVRLQIALGIATLLGVVRVWLGVARQAGALLLRVSLVLLAHRMVKA